jgi:hypothetical protein
MRKAPAPAPAAPCFKQHLPHRGGGDGDSDSLQLAGDALVSPVWILASKAEDHRAQRRLEWRPARLPVQIGPAVSDQLAVPAKQGVRLDREARPNGPWQRAAPRRQQRAISAGQPWLGSLPAQNRQLVAQDENLELLRATRTRE